MTLPYLVGQLVALHRCRPLYEYDKIVLYLYVANAARVSRDPTHRIDLAVAFTSAAASMHAHALRLTRKSAEARIQIAGRRSSQTTTQKLWQENCCKVRLMAHQEMSNEH